MDAALPRLGSFTFVVPQKFKFRLTEHPRDVKHTGAALQHFRRQRVGHIEAEILIFQTQRDRRRHMTQWREGHPCPRGVDDGFDMIRTAHFALSRKLLLQLGDRYRRTNRQVVISPFPQPGIVQTRLPEVQPGIMLGAIATTRDGRLASSRSLSKSNSGGKTAFSWSC